MELFHAIQHLAILALFLYLILPRLVYIGILIILIFALMR